MKTQLYLVFPVLLFFQGTILGNSGILTNNEIDTLALAKNVNESIDLPSSFSTPSGNIIQGNYIGTDASGTIDLGNGTGIFIFDGDDNSIGGTLPGESNTIAFNGTGIHFDSGVTNNESIQNTFYCNTSAGIVNPSLSPPIITSANTTEIIGTAGAGNQLEIFSVDNSLCPNAPSQGANMLGTVIADGSGNWSLSGSFSVGSEIVAYTTEAIPTSNTSAFSAATTVISLCTMPPNLGVDIEICQGEMATLDAGAGYEAYLWSTGETTQTIQVSTTGNYEVTVTYNGGHCTDVDAIDVTVNFIPEITFTSIDASCPNSNDGFIDLTLNFGNPPITYSWSTTNGSGLDPTSEDQTGLSSGEYIVTLTDVNGCTISEIIDILGTPDNTPPSIICPSNIIQNTDASLCSAFVSIAAPSVADNCTVASFSNDYNGTNDATDTYLLGTTNVNWSVTDDSGNTSSCIQEIIIEDVEPPFVSNCPGDFNVLADTGNCEAQVDWAVPTFTDNCTISSISNSHAPNQIFALGTTTVSYIAIDNSSNSSFCTFNITVNDNPSTSNLIESICNGDSFQVGSSFYSTTGIYQDVFTAANGCDSIVNLNLTVLPSIITDLSSSICDGDMIQVGSSTYTQTGVYQDILTAANGCDSIVNLNLTILPDALTNLVISICAGDVYQVGNSFYAQTGVYQDVFTAANGCDSIVNLDLTVFTFEITNLNEAICEGESFTVGGTNFNTTGVFAVTLNSSQGCDSLILLDLTVLPSSNLFLNETICNGESYELGASTFDQTGTYQETLTNLQGCDSIVDLNLTVLDPIVTFLDETICNGDIFEVGNQPFLTDGIYFISLLASSGCDSLIELNLSVLDVFETNLNISICEGENYQVGNSFYNQPGSYQENLTATNGCDSIINLTLAVLESDLINLEASICEGDTYSIGSNQYTTTGSYMVNLTNANGCDSIINLNLNVTGTQVTNLTESICLGQSFNIGNESFSQTGTYQVVFNNSNGCDSIINLELNVAETQVINLNESICQGQAFDIGNESFSETGTYQVVFNNMNGCDSIINLELNVFENPLPQISAPTFLCDGTMTTISTNNFEAYSWNTGDQNEEIQINLSGDYSVTVTDENGCTGTNSISIGLSCADVVADFQVQDTACVAYFVEFSNTSFGSTEWFWDFGNGNFSIQENPFTIYPDTGTFEVILIAKDGITEDTISKSIHVYPHVEALFSATAPAVCEPNQIVFDDLSNSTFEINSWQWTFGDGQQSSTSEPSHLYSNFDTVSVSMTVVDRFGCLDSIRQDVIVLDNGAVPEVTYIDSTLCQGGTLTFNGVTYDESNPFGLDTLSSYLGCDSIIQIQLDFQSLESFFIGNDTTICENESLELIAPPGTSYEWSTGSSTQNININQSGSYSVTVSDDTCPKIGTIQISIDTIPNEFAEAGLNMDICETQSIVTLNGATPVFSTGTWTSEGSGIFNNIHNPISTITNLDLNQNELVWTLSNGTCENFSSDTILINVTPEALDTAYAGLDLSLCNNPEEANLSAIAPLSQGVNGFWTQPEVQSMLGVEIVNPSDPQTAIKNLVGGNTYLFTWTLNNGACGDYSLDQVMVSLSNDLLELADAGDDQNLCSETETVLEGNFPPNTSGEWTLVQDTSSAFIESPFSNSTMVADLSFGTNSFAWTLSADNCPHYSSDTIQVFQNEIIEANADVYFNLGQPLINLDFLANDRFSNREAIQFNLLSTPLYGSLEANIDGTFDFTFGSDTTSSIEFRYEICLIDCPDLCSQANVVILTEAPPAPPPPIKKPANVISANNDGTGDLFAIPNFDEVPPPIEIVVFNRWGDVVFDQKNYTNDWSGKSNAGKELPEGTYFYLIKGAGSEVNGQVTIVR